VVIVCYLKAKRGGQSTEEALETVRSEIPSELYELLVTVSRYIRDIAPATTFHSEETSCFGV